MCSDDFECIPQYVAKRRAAAAAPAAHDRSLQEKPETFFLNTCGGTGGLLAVWMRDEPMRFILGLAFFTFILPFGPGQGR